MTYPFVTYPLYVSDSVAEKLEAELRSSGFTTLADELHESIEKAKASTGGAPEPWEGDSPCEECGTPNACWFAPNRVWNAVMGEDKQKTICVNCFAKKAFDKGYTGAWMLAPEQENDSVFWDIAQTLTNSYGTIRATQVEGEAPAFGRNIVGTVLAYFKDTPWPGYAMRGWGRTRR